MTTVAVICEYNPFHNGHLYQLRKIREAFGDDCTIVALMSGNFVQRGDVAVLDKYVRARAAVDSGVSLVLELPFPYSSSSAEYFASAGVHVLNAIGKIDVLAFGTDAADTDAIVRVAGNIASLPSSFSRSQTGYPAERFLAYEEKFGTADREILSSSNNILAIEYVRALTRTRSTIRPFAVPRVGCVHDDDRINGCFASASLIREKIRANEDYLPFVPDTCRSLYRSSPVSDIKRLSNAILAFLRIQPPAYFDTICECKGGLGRRLHHFACQATSLSTLHSLVATKKYTNARIRRATMFALFGTTSAEVRARPVFTTVLAMDACGRAFLSSVRRTAQIHLLTKPADYRKLPLKAVGAAEKTYRADSVYSLAFPEESPCTDFLRAAPYCKE